ncbi:MAG: protein-disulfide reductase DsbD family protein [Alphaproteobacteria bacterium]|nr:protein-disulfide reductase DsbD family protein [Alphaproteobacteria bacterium]
MTVLRHISMAAALWLGLVAALMPAHALVDGPWVDMDPARYRMIAAEVDGRAYAALQVELKPGWHTYWRYPGASGLEPEFDFSESRGIEAGMPLFPAPYFFDDGVGGFNGYKDMAGFVFPLAMQLNGELAMRGLIGVCREVCVPMEVSQRLVFNRDGLAASPHKAAIKALLQAQPQEPSDDLIIRSASFDGVSIQLVVSGTALEAVSVITIPGPHDIIGLARTVGRDEDAFLLEMPAWSKLDHPLIGRKLTFIVRAGARAIEQNIQLRDHSLLPQEPLTRQ